jgi:putative peptide zinc metalloprotease protein
MDVWLFGVHGAMTSVLRVLEQPIWMLIVFVLTVASLVFHEFGHASACRYSGATPGKIGYGIFLIWPSMYTDVTDVYRVGRGGRLRTGLGGVYFNVVFMLILAAAYAATGQPYFLAAVYLTHFEVLEQLMPAVRLDGYYILGDLAGVPDLYGKVKPILLSMLPGRPVHPEVADLKRSARIVVTVWVATMIPLLLAETGYALWNLPRLVSTSMRSLVEQLTGTFSAFGDGQIAAGLVGVIGSLMLICPMAGGAYLTVRLAGRLVRGAVRVTEGNSALRAAIGIAALTGVSILIGAWMHGATPKPLPPAPPVAPVLQPGVPTTRPSPTGPDSARVTVRPADVPTHPHAQRTVPATRSFPSGGHSSSEVAPTNSVSPRSSGGSSRPSTPEGKETPTATPARSTHTDSPLVLSSIAPTPSESASATTDPTSPTPVGTDSASGTP